MEKGYRIGLKKCGKRLQNRVEKCGKRLQNQIEKFGKKLREVLYMNGKMLQYYILERDNSIKTLNAE